MDAKFEHSKTTQPTSENHDWNTKASQDAFSHPINDGGKTPSVRPAETDSGAASQKGLNSARIENDGSIVIAGAPHGSSPDTSSEKTGTDVSGKGIVRSGEQSHGDAATAPADSGSEKVSPSDATGASVTDVAAERQKLGDWAQKNLRGSELHDFRQNMNEFEDRAAKQDLSQNEVLDTYKQIDRLTEAAPDAPVPLAERQHLAQTVMQYAAEPGEISQGYHGTCNVTTVESRTFTNNPATAAKLITDVSLTGQYHANDGSKNGLTVQVDPTAHDQSKVWPTDDQDGIRSHASEIFQVTAANLYWAAKGDGTYYKQVDRDPTDKADTGERLINRNTNKEVTGPDGSPIRNPDLTVADVAKVNNLIAGKVEKDVVLSSNGTMEAGSVGDSSSVDNIHSEADLRSALTRLKKEGGLPVIISVNAFEEPFHSDSGASAAGAMSPDSGHVVTITDYNPAKDSVSLNNQWSKNANHDSINPVSVHQLFTAMQNSHDAEKIVANDIKNESQNGLIDTAKDVDLIRHGIANKDGNNEIIQNTSQLIDDIKAKAKLGASTPWDSQNLDALVSQMSPSQQLSVARKEEQAGLISQDKYNQESDQLTPQLSYLERAENWLSSRF